MNIVRSCCGSNRLTVFGNSDYIVDRSRHVDSSESYLLTALCVLSVDIVCDVRIAVIGHRHLSLSPVREPACI